ncbi:guanine nucleotide-binding protein-like 3-like protein [Plakobranchus ocellatus]|uniref:Guanine nucleotide-binding protein-like 3-like protein n=1 Tax=Plakobranchus ocellatus TaxID=259542 RepID=A0AAV4C867_9GAST|nr:guanine nucleotide-binding protein-like 3-like protein [Plakobranchus ocellatus]
MSKAYNFMLCDDTQDADVVGNFLSLMTCSKIFIDYNRDDNPPIGNLPVSIFIFHNLCYISGKKSKRQTTKHRVKVEKKVREHNRKLRKEAKKNPKKASKRKDPGVPNILPFKEEVIKEAQAYNAKKEEEREKKKAARKKARERLQNKNRNMGDVIRDAEKRQAAYDKQNNPVLSTETSSSVNKSAENSRKAFYKEFKKVIDAADVVLEVLDARDPHGSRSLEVEEAIRSAPGNKRLVLVLNKIDLVPKENVEAWLKYLRKELPAVAFKASTQQQRDHLTQSKVDYYTAASDLLKSSHCLGADVLMKLLRNYCRSTEMAINVGVVGFPNTGKSSIINSLKRAKACEVGANPGITKAMQSVHLDKHIKLLDSPGVVLTNSPSDVAAVLRNVVKLESLDDPVPCVEAILTRCQKMQMMLHYNIADYSDTLSFLNLLAYRMGKLRKGGVPDINQAARALLQDWNSGKISYYTAPPEEKSEAAHHVEAKIVSNWSKEFNIDDLLIEEQQMMEGVLRKNTSPMLIASVDSLKAVTREEELEPTEQAMGDDNDDGEDEGETSGEEDMEDDEGASEVLISSI